jgi:hypothetical protein
MRRRREEPAGAAAAGGGGIFSSAQFAARFAAEVCIFFRSGRLVVSWAGRIPTSVQSGISSAAELSN